MTHRPLSERVNLRRLKLWARALVAPRRVERDLDDELAFHLERETRKHLANGIGLAEARRRATAQFGSVTVTADECRDARGLSLVEHTVRDALYAWRSFRRAPLAALTIVTTVALGLGLVTVVFTLLNAFVFRVDAVRNPYELFAVERPRTGDAEPELFRRAQFDDLRHETRVFADAFAMTPELDSWIDGRRMEGPLVAGNFFQVLGVSAARGRTLTPSDDEPGGRRVIVLSHNAWTRHFDRDAEILDRTVQVNGAPFHVVGVMPESFRGLAVVAPDYWAPLALLGEVRPAYRGREDAFGLQIVGRLAPGVSRGRALGELVAWDARRAAERGIQQTGPALVLEPRLGTVPQPAEAMLIFTPLFFAFGLILMIGCANVANLLLARGVARQREIGIRLAIGASRRRIVAQLFTESLVLALAAAALGYAVSRVALATTVYAITSTFPPDFGDIRLAVPPADWRVALFLVAGAIVSTLFFALAPALQATRFELVRAVRGEVVRDARPGRARDMLVALQVTGSVLLLICSAVFLRSSWAAATVDPGIRIANIVNVAILNEERRGALLDIVRREPSVAAFAATHRGRHAALAEGATGKATVDYQFVSPEYFGILDIPLVRGRGFTAIERTASDAVAVVSEGFARQLWPAGDALGQLLHLQPDPTHATAAPDDPPLVARSVIVVGVARDVAGFRFGVARAAGPGVYLPTSVEDARTSLTIRVRGDAERGRHTLVDRFAAIDPNMSEVATLQTMARMEAYLLGIPFWLTLVLGGLALVLTLSGLFGVLSYLVEQRTREFGVRMTLGATRRGIAALVLSQSARPVGLGLALGSCLTAALGAALLSSEAAAAIGTSVRLFDPLAYAASLLCIVAACAGAALVPALRAGRIDPVGALRQE